MVVIKIKADTHRKRTETSSTERRSSFIHNDIVAKPIQVKKVGSRHGRAPSSNSSVFMGIMQTLDDAEDESDRVRLTKAAYAASISLYRLMFYFSIYCFFSI
jgi:hypothetical protein